MFVFDCTGQKYHFFGTPLWPLIFNGLTFSEKIYTDKLQKVKRMFYYVKFIRNMIMFIRNMIILHFDVCFVVRYHVNVVVLFNSVEQAN